MGEHVHEDGAVLYVDFEKSACLDVERRTSHSQKLGDQLTQEMML